MLHNLVKQKALLLWYCFSVQKPSVSLLPEIVKWELFCFKVLNNWDPSWLSLFLILYQDIPSFIVRLAYSPSPLQPYQPWPQCLSLLCYCSLVLRYTLPSSSLLLFSFLCSTADPVFIVDMSCLYILRIIQLVSSPCLLQALW